MWRHILPNSLTPVVTLVPFEMVGAIGSLTSLDFLGLGVPPGPQALAAALSGKNNLDAWWLPCVHFRRPGDHPAAVGPDRRRLRDALDPRKVLKGDQAMSLLDVRDLSVHFGARRAVERVSFSLEAGEKLALVGESASGKTVTALSTMRLIESARLSGEIFFEGKGCAEDVAAGAARAARDATSPSSSRSR